MSTPTIRTALQSDLPAVTDLYNYYVRETPITFDLRPFEPEERREWFEQFGETGPHRLIVAEVEGTLRGYACSTRVRPKAAYDTSVEVTIYVHPDVKRTGIGRVLYGRLFELLAAEGVHRVYAVITLPNDPSINIHEAFGFAHVGTLHEVGRKFDQYWDVAWYEKSFD